MSKEKIVGSALTDNWAEKCVLLKKMFPRLTDGDLEYIPGNPGAEGKLFDELTVKTGLTLDSLHQLVYNMLKVNEIPLNIGKKTEKANSKSTDEESPAVKEDEKTEEKTKEIVSLGLTEEVFTNKKEKILENFDILDSDDLDFDSDTDGSFEAMLEYVAELVGLDIESLVLTINSL